MTLGRMKLRDVVEEEGDDYHASKCRAREPALLFSAFSSVSH